MHTLTEVMHTLTEVMHTLTEVMHTLEQEHMRVGCYRSVDGVVDATRGLRDTGLAVAERPILQTVLVIPEESTGFQVRYRKLRHIGASRITATGDDWLERPKEPVLVGERRVYVEAHRAPVPILTITHTYSHILTQTHTY
jgi:hypothetical protein